MKIKHHHLIQWLGIPALLIGSDLCIGFYGHYSGSVGNVFSIENLIEYFSSVETLQQLVIIFAVAIVIMYTVEWLVTQKLKHHQE